MPATLPIDSPPPRNARDRILDALASLTMATLCCLPAWELLLGGTPRLFVLEEASATAIVLPLLGITGGLGVLFHRCRPGRRSPGSPALAAAWFLGGLWVAFNLARLFIFSTFIRSIPTIAGSARIKMAIPLVLALALVALAALAGLGRWNRWARTLLLVLSPLAGMIWLQLPWHVASTFRTLPGSLPGRDSHRTIWILVFDELDAQTALDAPVATTGMSQLAEWRTWTTVFTRAYPPTGATLYSIPAMAQGRQITASMREPDYEFSLGAILRESVAAHWNWSDSIFRDIQEQGGSCAIIGWCFPYAPLYGRNVARTDWVAERAGYDLFPGPQDAWHLTARILAESTVGPLLYATENSERHARSHRMALDGIQKDLDATLRGPLPDLVWVHFPVPHWPAVSHAGGTYLDNLRVVDQVLGSFRDRLKAAGRFDEATVLVLADHWFRHPTPDLASFAGGLEHRWDRRDHRVPFLLKLPNQAEGHEDGRPFNTILLRDLIRGLRKGELRDREQIGAWLAGHTPYAESPLTLDLP